MGIITLITGPGTHAHLIIHELNESKKEFQVAEYWPYPKITRYDKGGIKWERKFIVFNLLNHLLWGIFNKLNLTTGYKRHLDILFPLYYITVSLYLKNTDFLIAWPQVSLISISKVKKKGGIVHLEYPLIHIDEYMNIMMAEYKKLRIPVKHTSNLFSPYMVNRIKKEITLSDRVTVLSTYARGTFIKHGFDNNKINLRKIKPDGPFIKKQERTVPSSFNILYAGRLDILKGTHYLLQAFFELNIPDTELWLAGNISKELDPFIKKYSKEKIRFLGYLSKEKLFETYSMASVFILPSLQESFGMVITEALHSGVPVIASRNSGGPDLIQHGKNGFLYDPMDHDSLKNYLLALYHNRSLLSEMSDNALMLCRDSTI